MRHCRDHLFIATGNQWVNQSVQLFNCAQSQLICFPPLAMLSASSVYLVPLCLNKASESSAAAVFCMTLKSFESAVLKGQMENSEMYSFRQCANQVTGLRAATCYPLNTLKHILFFKYHRN